MQFMEGKCKIYLNMLNMGGGDDAKLRQWSRVDEKTASERRERLSCFVVERER